LDGRQASVPECHDPILLQPAGCFVTLHNLGGKLRGCIGRIDAAEPLIAAVSAAAVSVLSDPRFSDEPVTHGDLAQLEIELSILSPQKLVEDMLAFDPINDGIILTIGNRTGCFLPQVARNTGWSRQQLLARLCTEKLGLRADAWQSPKARLFVFKTVIVGPERFERPIASVPNVGNIEENR
jgi:AmmeMemoRadiSam system protein A